ncbi:MAG: hypothetical protein IPL87_04575 [Candidatus Moraniibacteriota bacterium]|nr:MAG: hypothetical protein IPL87_04575 [Candidatus Moranbacteria bacterium]
MDTKQGQIRPLQPVHPIQIRRGATPPSVFFRAFGAPILFPFGFGSFNLR